MVANEAHLTKPLIKKCFEKSVQIPTLHDSLGDGEWDVLRAKYAKCTSQFDQEVYDQFKAGFPACVDIFAKNGMIKEKEMTDANIPMRISNDKRSMPKDERCESFQRVKVLNWKDNAHAFQHTTTNRLAALECNAQRKKNKEAVDASILVLSGEQLDNYQNEMVAKNDILARRAAVSTYISKSPKQIQIKLAKLRDNIDLSGENEKLRLHHLEVTLQRTLEGCKKSLTKKFKNIQNFYQIHCVMRMLYLLMMIKQ